jgi:peroxiredoxin
MLRDHGWSVLVNSLRFGQEAPGFSLPSTSGNQAALADFKGKSDVVLVFYCYDWGSI